MSAAVERRSLWFISVSARWTTPYLAKEKAVARPRPEFVIIYLDWLLA